MLDDLLAALNEWAEQRAKSKWADAHTEDALDYVSGYEMGLWDAQEFIKDWIEAHGHSYNRE